MDKVLVLCNLKSKNTRRLSLLENSLSKCGISLVVGELPKFYIRYTGDELEFGFRDININGINSCILLSKHGFENEFSWASFCLDRINIIIHGSTKRRNIKSTKIGDILNFSNLHIPQLPSFYIGSEYLLYYFDDLSTAWGLPLVLKINGLTGRGQGVFLIKNERELIKYIKLNPSRRMLLQKYIEIDHDYRVWVVGDKVVLSYKRYKSELDFRSNKRYHKSILIEEIPDAIKNDCIKFAKFMDCDILAFDIIISNGFHYFLEANICPDYSNLPAKDIVPIEIAKLVSCYPLQNGECNKSC